VDPWGLSGSDNRWGGHGHNRRGYKEDCWTQCMKDRAIWWGSALGLTGAPLSNLKRPQDYHSFGGGKGNKSPFTSIDKKWPNLPGANPKGGFKIQKGSIDRMKPVGTWGSAAWAAGAFGLGLGIGTSLDCWYKCSCK